MAERLAFEVLQVGTPTSVMVRWRCDTPAIGRVRFAMLLGSADKAKRQREEQCFFHILSFCLVDITG